METLYIYDEYGIYKDTVTVDDLTVLLPNSTTEVPTFEVGAVTQFVNGAWVIKYPYVYTVAELAQIDALGFANVKSEKLQALNAWHDQQTSAMKAKYSQSEVDSFLDKRNEAMAWRTDGTVATPYVTAMSMGDHTVRLMLLNAILAKVDATAHLEAYVLSKRDAIEACTTQSQLDAIAW